MPDYWYWWALAWLYVNGCLGWHTSLVLAYPMMEAEHRDALDNRLVWRLAVITWPITVPLIELTTRARGRG